MEKAFFIRTNYKGGLSEINYELSEKGATVKQIVPAGIDDGNDSHVFFVLEYPEGVTPTEEKNTGMSEEEKSEWRRLMESNIF